MQDSDPSGLSAAAMISLAKVWDTTKRPARSIGFCVVQGGQDLYFSSPMVPLEETSAIFWMGPMGGPELSVENLAAGRYRVLAMPEPSNPPAGTKVPFDQANPVDYRIVEQHVRGLAARVQDALEGGS